MAGFVQHQGIAGVIDRRRHAVERSGLLVQNRAFGVDQRCLDQLAGRGDDLALNPLEPSRLGC
ncbi:MAG: hypothetical protein ACK46L_06605 [Synechococcaceae cyanobacterium]